MKNEIRIVFTAVLLLFVNSEILSQNFRVMTYNIRVDFSKEDVNSWDKRFPMIEKQLKFYEPDIMGIQEALPNQMEDLTDILEDYEFVGVGREDNLGGEYSAIWYNNTSLEIIESGTFWLSETPETPSKGWDAALNRICTYALFKSIDGENKFWVFNTHLDHMGKMARKNSCDLILDKIRQLNPDKLPLVLMGDFNLEPIDDAIKRIKDVLEDARDNSHTIPYGPIATFNDFDYADPEKRQIDYIFVNDRIKVKKFGVIYYVEDHKFPSDHFPLLVDLSLTE